MLRMSKKTSINIMFMVSNSLFFHEHPKVLINGKYCKYILLTPIWVIRGKGGNFPLIT